MSLRLDWCSFRAAKHAVEHWHYSRCMPAGKTVKVGVWEDDRFIGCVIFSRGINQHIGKQFGLSMTECCELTRVALDRHKTPVTRILAIALKMLKKQSSGIRLVVSYAGCDQDYHGGIYAGGGWAYIGKVQLNGGTPKYLIHGKVVHGRSVHSKHGRGARRLSWLRQHVDPEARHVWTKGMHKYVMPLDDDMKRTVDLLRQPYPKRAGSVDSDTAESHAAEGGASPTPALQDHGFLPGKLSGH